MTIMAQAGIASLLAWLTPVAAARLWPRYEVDHAAWDTIGRLLGQGGGDLIGLWAEEGQEGGHEGGQVHLALRATNMADPAIVTTGVVNSQFPSVGRHHAPAIRLERAIRDLYGHVPAGTPDERPWLDHGAWGVCAPLGARTAAGLSDPAAYDFLPVTGQGLHQIPVGPVHAGIIEPGHFRFTANGETVVRLEERLGYVHKGTEWLMTGATIDKGAKLASRTSGDSTAAYALAFAQAVESALQINVPERAVWLRALMAELERLANHFGDIGAICNDASFSLAFAECGILRERTLRAAQSCFGHRLMMDRIVPGGVTDDLGEGGIEALRSLLETVRLSSLAWSRFTTTPHPSRTALSPPAISRRRSPAPSAPAAMSAAPLAAPSMRARRSATRLMINSNSRRRCATTATSTHGCGSTSARSSRACG
jgi:hypothetical protein